MPTLHKFDLTSPTFKRDPFPELRRMRNAGPVIRAKIPIMGKVWMATTYDAASELLRDHKRFVRDGRNAGKSRLTDIQWWFSHLFKAASQNMLAKDEPDHRRLRHLVDDAFQRRSVEGMRDRIETLTDQLLDASEQQAHADGAMEFVSFARELPLAVISELLGLPEGDRPMFARLAGTFNKAKALLDLFSAFPVMFKISSYFRKQIRDCRAHPRDGLLSLLTEVEHEGDSLSEDELLSMAFLLLFAGHETTVHLLSNNLLTLLAHRDHKTALMSDWSNVEVAVEELHRFDTPIQFTKPRIAAENMNFFGVDIKRGQYLIAMLASANSDPAQFTDPEALDLNRHPNPHLGYGTGIHICLGLKLARLEVQIALRRLLTRYPELRLAIPADQIQWNPRIGVRSIESLPLLLK